MPCIPLLNHPFESIKGTAVPSATPPDPSSAPVDAQPKFATPAASVHQLMDLWVLPRAKTISWQGTWPNVTMSDRSDDHAWDSFPKKPRCPYTRTTNLFTRSESS